MSTTTNRKDHINRPWFLWNKVNQPPQFEESSSSYDDIRSQRRKERDEHYRRFLPFVRVLVKSDIGKLIVKVSSQTATNERYMKVYPESNPIDWSFSEKVWTLKDIHLNSHKIPCRNCKKLNPEKMYMCSKCKSVKYCSKECQTTHWKVCHKFGCGLDDPLPLEGIYLELDNESTFAGPQYTDGWVVIEEVKHLFTKEEGEAFPLFVF